MPDFTIYTTIAATLLLFGSFFLSFSLLLEKKISSANKGNWISKASAHVGQASILFGLGFLSLGFILLLNTRLPVF